MGLLRKSVSQYHNLKTAAELGVSLEQEKIKNSLIAIAVTSFLACGLAGCIYNIKRKATVSYPPYVIEITYGSISYYKEVHGLEDSFIDIPDKYGEIRFYLPSCSDVAKGIKGTDLLKGTYVLVAGISYYFRKIKGEYFWFEAPGKWLDQSKYRSYEFVVKINGYAVE